MRAIGTLLLTVAIGFTLMTLLSSGLLLSAAMALQWLFGTALFQLGGVEVLLGAILLHLLWESALRAEREYAERENTPQFKATILRMGMFLPSRKNSDEARD